MTQGSPPLPPPLPPDVRAVLGLPPAAEPADELKPAPEPLKSVLNDTSGGHMKNATMAANAYEVRATDPIESGKEVTGGHGTNTGGFELRVTQEQGTH